MKHVVLYVGHMYKPFWTKKIWPGWQGGSGKVKIMHFCTFPIEMTQMCHILTFPGPSCRPGQIFLVQNGLYMCPTYSTTCFIFRRFQTFHTFLATKPLLPHILSYPPGSLKELIFLIFTETWSLQVFTTENFQQLDCDIHRQERRPHGHGKIWEIRLFTMKM